MGLCSSHIFIIFVLLTFYLFYFNNLFYAFLSQSIFYSQYTTINIFIPTSFCKEGELCYISLCYMGWHIVHKTLLFFQYNLNYLTHIFSSKTSFCILLTKRFLDWVLRHLLTNLLTCDNSMETLFNIEILWVDQDYGLWEPNRILRKIWQRFSTKLLSWFLLHSEFLCSGVNILGQQTVVKARLYYIILWAVSVSKNESIHWIHHFRSNLDHSFKSFPKYFFEIKKKIAYKQSRVYIHQNKKKFP